MKAMRLAGSDDRAQIGREIRNIEEAQEKERMEEKALARRMFGRDDDDLDQQRLPKQFDLEEIEFVKQQFANFVKNEDKRSMFLPFGTDMATVRHVLKDFPELRLISADQGWKIVK